jgi:PAS domain S-box-containing protein
MTVSEHERELLRRCSKDDSTFNELLTMFAEHDDRLKQDYAQAHTAREQAAQALLDNGEFARAIADNAPVAIYVFDADTLSPIYVNAAYEQQVGYTMDEILSLGSDYLARIYHPDDAERWLESDRQLLNDRSGRVYEGEYRIIWPDGAVRWVLAREWILTRKADGSPQHLIGIAQDTTDRKHMEEALRRSEAQYRLIAENASDGIFAWDARQNRFTYTSPAYDRQWGRVVGASVNRAMDEIYAAVHPDDRDALFAQIEAAIDDGAPTLTYTYRGQHADGDYRWREDHATFNYAPDGTYLGAYVISRDITERKQAEDELRATADRLRRLVEYLPVMVDAFDDTGQIVLWNRECELVTGYSKDEIVGNADALTLLYPDANYRTEMLATRDTLPLNFRNWELSLTSKDGAKKHISWSNISDKVVLDGRCEWAVGIDITERREMEDALRAGEQQFRALVEQSSDFIARLDRDGVHHYVNPAYAEAIGQTVDAIIGKTNAEVGITPHLLPTLDAARDRIYEEGREVTLQFPYVLNDGMEHMLDARLVPEFDADGKVRMILAAVRDITELQQAQQHEFALALERERLNLLTRFVRTAAHEFRNPLAVIGTSAYIMARSDDAERRFEKASQIEHQVMRLARLVNMLLLTVKLESGRAPEREPLELAVMLQSICQEVGQQYEDGPAIHCDIPASLPSLIADADLLAEAIKQLLDNACRFTPAAGTVTLSAGINAGECWVAVADTGPGIPAEALPHIFETFWRDDSAHTTPGFGLGLPIVRKIARLHDGDVTVTSTPGEGSRFCLVLPQAS